MFLRGKVRCVFGFLFLLPLACRGGNVASQNNRVYVCFLPQRALTDRHPSRKKLCVTPAEPFHGNTAPSCAAAEAAVTITAFMVTLFHDLAIIHLGFRKSVSSLWYIPSPQPV